MRIGPILPNSGDPSRANMFAVVRLAEDLGYDSLWTPAHTAIPLHFESRYPYNATGRPRLDATTPWGDAFISLTLAAEFTERVRLGPSLIPLIITDPLTLAKQAATRCLFRRSARSWNRRRLARRRGAGTWPAHRPSAGSARRNDRNPSAGLESRDLLVPGTLLEFSRSGRQSKTGAG